MFLLFLIPVSYPTLEHRTLSNCSITHLSVLLYYTCIFDSGGIPIICINAEEPRMFCALYSHTQAFIPSTSHCLEEYGSPFAYPIQCPCSSSHHKSTAMPPNKPPITTSVPISPPNSIPRELPLFFDEELLPPSPVYTTLPPLVAVASMLLLAVVLMRVGFWAPQGSGLYVRNREHHKTMPREFENTRKEGQSKVGTGDGGSRSFLHAAWQGD